MIFKKYLAFTFFTILIFYACQPTLVRKQQYNYDDMDPAIVDIHKNVEDFILTVQQGNDPVYIPASTRIENIIRQDDEKYLGIVLSEVFTQIPFREENVTRTYARLKEFINDDFDNYKIEIISLNKPIEQLIPNYYRNDRENWDSERMFKPSAPAEAIVRRKNPDLRISAGLYNRNIVLWPSHGWYYNSIQDRWMWQRPRIFGTVEDLLPLSFVVPFITPMLENAGANVFIPRERDTQLNEIIVDNDSLYSEGNLTSYAENRKNNQFIWQSGAAPGYAIGSPPYPVNFNPFRSGSYRFTTTDTVASTTISWTPFFPDTGYYAVYVSYYSSPENSDDAHYTVYHSGDSSQFLVNQQMGGSTWIYLGRFKFNKGYNPQNGRVALSNKSRTAGKIVTADAVRFGGGLGNVLRNGQVSGRPKFNEGARYYLQTAGFPDSLVYRLNRDHDYRDDYQSRGEWANYLNGAPKGPNRDRQAGLNVPIDASLAFHTDAGITRNDTTIGTLQIYSVVGSDTSEYFPDGVSRFASRDFSDIMQSQIVDDIRQLYDPWWSRRYLWERQYSEATRPNMPSTLLELLSHQNFLDMQFALDPRFRFDVSRSIYKSFLRFISAQYGQQAVVQPLPVDHFAARFNADGHIELSWQPVSDPLEESAVAKAFKIYTRIDDQGFNNGQLTSSGSFIFEDPRPGTIYSFKVTALNEGGESFPSEVLAVGKMESSDEPVLIINGFDRIAPPVSFKQGDFSGFAYFLDNGVPYKYDYGFTGDQFNFDATDRWHTDDRPGHGASYGDQEARLIAGNTFDYPYIHGKAIKNAGYSFVSCSDEAVMDSIIDMNDYKITDLILGEEKETGWQRSMLDTLKGRQFKTFPEKLKRAVRSFLDNGNSLFISGAYIGSDLFDKTQPYPDQFFAESYLKFSWRSGHAVRNGQVFNPVNAVLKLPDFAFNTDYRQDIYRVEAPDAIGPIDGSSTILRYSENGFDAAVAWRGDYKIVLFAFPFETILGNQAKNNVMSSVLNFLKK